MIGLHRPWAAGFLACAVSHAAETPLSPERPWQAADPQAWKWSVADGKPVLDLIRQSQWQPPVRSPFNLIWLDDLEWYDFDLRVEIRLTKFDDGNNDACIAFAGRDDRHFHYAHLGEKADEVHLQLHRVNNAPREAFTATRAESIFWQQGTWHEVRMLKKGPRVTVWFDGREVLDGSDGQAAWGRIGLGSFDDTASLRGLRIDGKSRTRP